MDLDTLVSLPILSVRQPWASFIVSGVKRVELRSWQTEYRGWIWIHAGKQPDAAAIEIFGLTASDFRVGGLLGLAYLDSCERIESATQWHAMRNDHRSPGTFVEGTFAWTFSDVIALTEPIACRGELRLFSFDENSRREVAARLRGAPIHQEFLHLALQL